MKGERRFRNQDEIHLLASPRGHAGDEAGVAAHQFDEPDPAGRAAGLSVGQVDDISGHVDGGQVTESPVAIVDIVVDGFRDADHGDGPLPAANLLANRIGAAMGAIAADAKKHINLLLFEKINHHAHVLRPARRAEHRATFLVNLADERAGQNEGWQSSFRVQPAKAVAEPEHFLRRN